jgi:hypothetical protein
MSEFRFPRRRSLPMRPAGTFGPVGRPGPADKIGDIGMLRGSPAAPDRMEYRQVPPTSGVPVPDRMLPGSYKRGGKVKRTGLAKLHKGEQVVKASTPKKLSGPKIAAAARKRPASRTTPRPAAAPQRAAKPIARKPSTRRR